MSEDGKVVYPRENLVRLVNRHIRPNRDLGDMVVVDIGCGSGRHLKMSKEMGFKGLVGVDILDKPMKEEVNLYCDRYIKGDITKDRVKYTGDFVIADAVLDHIRLDDLDRGIGYLRDSVEIGGYLYISFCKYISGYGDLDLLSERGRIREYRWRGGSDNGLVQLIGGDGVHLDLLDILGEDFNILARNEETNVDIDSNCVLRESKRQYFLFKRGER